MANPLFSILMLAMNQDRTILTAISSVLEFPDAELIIITGTSESSYYEFLIKELNKLYGNRIKVINKEDSGPPEGLNNGIKLAEGRIIGILNGDDLYLPGSLEYVGHIFQSEPDSQIVLGSGYVLREESGQMKPVLSRQMNKYQLALAPLSGSAFFQQGLFFLREPFSSIEFNIENKFAWDLEFFQELIIKEPRISVTSRPVAIFRIHHNSISGSSRLKDEYNRWLISNSFSLLGRRFRVWDYVAAFMFRLSRIFRTIILKLANNF